MKKLIVEKSKIENNIQVIKKAAGDAEIIAVIKANAYGLGLLKMAEICRENGISFFAVTDPEDAVTLRDNGFTDAKILILRSTACSDDIDLILRSNAIATIGSLDAAKELNYAAQKLDKRCCVHIKIDTGMGRYGFLPDELDKIISVYHDFSNLTVTGCYTHYANAFRSRKKTLSQYNSFISVIDKIRLSDCEPGILHASNSEALFGCRVPSLDAVRIGSALSGRVISKGDFGLIKTGGIVESEIAEIRCLPKGTPVGYGSTYITRRYTRIAVLPFGTADGYLIGSARSDFRFHVCLRTSVSELLSFLTHRAPAIKVQGKHAPVIGQIGVNHIVIDVTDIECSPGTPAFINVNPIFVPSTIEREFV